MRAPALGPALVAAACAHLALGFVLVRRHGPERAPQAARDVPDEALFTVTEEPPEPSPRPALPADVVEREAPAAEGRLAAASVAPADGARATVAPEAALAPAPSSSGEPWSMPWQAPLAVGVDGYWKSVALAARSAAPSATGPTDAPSARPSLDRLLRADLEARDRSLGLGASGPLVSAAHEASGSTLAPDLGVATLEFECDGTGKVVSARVVSASAEPAQWGAVAREILRLASARPLHVPPGSRGVRTRLRIVAERAPPAGTKHSTAPGAVPDDLPGNGSGDAECVGEGWSRKCEKGMPAGASGTIGDLSNLGARRTRIVHVAVAGEETL